MRDINRIDPLLAKLGEAWKKSPDQRFGQFMYHFFSLYGKDPFYTEDDEWMVGIQAYIDGKDIAEAMEEYHRTNPRNHSIAFDQLFKSVRNSLQENAENSEKIEK